MGYIERISKGLSRALLISEIKLERPDTVRNENARLSRTRKPRRSTCIYANALMLECSEVIKLEGIEEEVPITDGAKLLISQDEICRAAYNVALTRVLAEYSGQHWGEQVQR